MKSLIFILLDFVVTQTIAIETETIYRPPTLDELVGIEITKFDVRHGKDGEFLVGKFLNRLYNCIRLKKCS